MCTCVPYTVSDIPMQTREDAHGAESAYVADEYPKRCVLDSIVILLISFTTCTVHNIVFTPPQFSGVDVP